MEADPAEVDVMSNTDRVMAVLSFAVVGLAFVAGRALWLASDDRAPAQPFEAHPAATPMMGQAEQFECPRALKKDIIWLGVEDGFDRSTEEIARPRQAVLRQAFYETVFTDDNLRYRYRDFDELGVDRSLYVSVTLPASVRSGFLMARVIVDDPLESDSISFSDLADPFVAVPSEARVKFDTPMKEAVLIPARTGLGDIVQVDFDRFRSRSGERPMSLTQYLQAMPPSWEPQGTVFDITIGDDTAVDAIAIVTCRDKPDRTGTTFTETTLDLEEDGLSLLSCGMDASQRPCDPFSGDTQCSVELPVACYTSSVSPPDPQPIPQGVDRFARFRVQGRITPSAPVRGDRFETREDVNDFCRKAFGNNHRILSFHESGAQGILSRSDIAPGQRVWVDVRDQPNGNCWRSQDGTEGGDGAGR